jgi:PPOX class probable FMN-dependent enzyme
MDITTLETLREHYAEPKERAVRKEIRTLDVHCRRFIGLSPFLILATSDPNHNMDASPRGGAPGFVKVTAEGVILIPDAPGNNRLDSFANIIATRKVGLLFLIPGIDETLRVNGSAVLSRAEADIALCTDERRAPKLAIRVTVEAAYLHCAKAFMRSKLWDASTHVDRDTLPTIGQMINDQAGMQIPAETREEMARRYAPDL